MKSKNRCLGITLGDPAGIGPEIVARALTKPSIRKLGPFKLIGNYDIYRRYTSSKLNTGSFIDVSAGKTDQIPLGKPNLAGARISLAALQTAVQLLKKGGISALVTAPVCKKTVGRVYPAFEGHTEFLADAFHKKNVEMMFVADKLRTVIVTRHIPLDKVSKAITVLNVSDTIKVTDQALTRLFKIRKPRIAVCGLNPHAGEGGTIGEEEIKTIIPAIQQSRRRGINVCGPFSADTLFSPDIARQYDTIVAMYHDQGLIPVKTLSFTKLVNLTIGLPFIRTSPAHGTAFDIAGKNRADPSSMCEAIKLAARLNI